MTPENVAAWLPARNGRIEVRPAPYTPPREREIVVHNRAVAINPIDGISGTFRRLVLPWLTYPAVLGSDVAGEVVEVGSAVSRFAVGDRVLGHALGYEKTRNRAAEGAFQHYTVLSDHMTSPIPDRIGFERAAVLPLGLSTAASGLFEKPLLGLRLPTASPQPTGETVVVWGGSTSVGSNAIQLAVNAGYGVVTTASPRNFEYVRGLGAREAFDYSSTTVVADIVRALQDHRFAGAIAIGAHSTKPCVDVARAVGGSKSVASATRGPGSVVDALRARLYGVRTGGIWGSSLKDNEVGPALYADFLPDALAIGTLTPAPEPMVIGHGLDHIAAGIETLGRGVSASKIVVTL